uniref:Uncharacterized protein n=1 Tax=Solanum lycopersicum TaxID=4081 RepID=A0A3Q7IE90_SOLLC
MLVLKLVVSMLMMLVVHMVDSLHSVDVPHLLLLFLDHVLHVNMKNAKIKRFN